MIDVTTFGVTLVISAVVYGLVVKPMIRRSVMKAMADDGHQVAPGPSRHRAPRCHTFYLGGYQPAPPDIPPGAPVPPPPPGHRSGAAGPSSPPRGHVMEWGTMPNGLTGIRGHHMGLRPPPPPPEHDMGIPGFRVPPGHDDESVETARAHEDAIAEFDRQLGKVPEEPPRPRLPPPEPPMSIEWL